MPKQRLVIAAALMAFGVNALAGIVSLHEKPTSSSQVVGQADTAKGVITIYQPKKSSWVKVANPHNGQVGWVPAKDLQQSSPMRTVQIIRYSSQSGVKPPPQVVDFLKQMRQEQSLMEQEMGHIPWFTQPIIIPVLIDSGQSKQAPKRSLSPPKQK